MSAIPRHHLPHGAQLSPQLCRHAGEAAPQLPHVGRGLALPHSPKRIDTSTSRRGHGVREERAINHTAEQCFRIAESASSTWYQYAPHISQRHDIAIGTVATATLIRMPHNDGQAVAELWEAFDDEELIKRLNFIWTLRWNETPYLWHAAKLLREWLEEDHDAKTLRAVRILMATVLRAGILDLTGSLNPAENVKADLLSPVVTHMRAAQARTKLGEIHTPPDYATLMAALQLGGAWTGPGAVARLPEPGAGICDPTAGTGGLIRATAEAIYQLGGNPGHYRWFMNDMDPIAAACSAANAMTWGLGDFVVVSCADILADPDAIEKQLPVMRKVLDKSREVRVAAALLARVQLLTRDDYPRPREVMEAVA